MLNTYECEFYPQLWANFSMNSSVDPLSTKPYFFPCMLYGIYVCVYFTVNFSCSCFLTTEMLRNDGNRMSQHNSSKRREEWKTYPASNWHDPIKLRVLLKGLKCNINYFVILALI